LPETLALTSPARIAEFDADHLLVSDYESNYIYIVDKNTLQPTAKIKVQGKSTGIAMADDKIFVGNRTLRSVDVFDLQGNLLYRLGSGKAQFLQINDVDVDPARRVVYALDTKGKCIKRFNLDGSSAGMDIGVGRLLQPSALTVDPANGNILVSDFGTPEKMNDSAVHLFDSTGAWKSTRSGKSGMSGFIFSSPQGSAISDNGNLYLVDSGLCQILVFTPTTSTPIYLGARGINSDELNYPLDVFLDAPTGDLFVSDHYNKRITVFRGGGLTP
jgi:YVTN family beta-propeller protein